MLTIFLVVALWAGSVQRPADVVKWSATARSVDGGTVSVSLIANVASGWKLYALTQPDGGPKPLSIELSSGAPFTISKKQIVAPKAKTMKDENFDLETRYYEGKVAFTVPVTASKPVAGSAQIPFEITFQACGNGICLRPFTEKVSAPVVIR